MNKESILPVLREWALRCVVWDGAPARKAKALAELPTARVPIPPYSPEPGTPWVPAERVFREVRRRVEGRVYESLKAKRGAAEEYLEGSKPDPERVRRLCGWSWLVEATESLPQPSLA